tara:strand:+ start:12575 stop:13528 length:954 start_codon:yes stop_codon:yes gene_type:complete
LAVFLTENDVKKLINMDITLKSLDEALFIPDDGQMINSPRSRLLLPNGFLNFMSAVVPSINMMGHKTYGVVRGHIPKFYIHLFSTETGELLAIIEASELGRIRTGASSGIATKYLANDDASSVGIIGTGYQSGPQLEAICKVRKISKAKVFSRNVEKREKFKSKMEKQINNIEIEPVNSAQKCVEDVDIIVTITTSRDPVVKGEWIRDGVHINAAGANHWMRRELDYEVVKRANHIIVDDVEQAKIECGDLIFPVERGSMRWQQVYNLSDVVKGSYSGRTNKSDVTLFESQGLAIQDILVGTEIYNLACATGVGKEI